YFPNGQKEHEREYREGEPVGTWLSWWSNGNPRSEVPNGTREPEATRWWHETGALECSGLSRGGVREGEWELFHPSGALAARGAYVGGQQQGEWSFFDDAGKLVESVVFRSGVRVRAQ
ncbi:MAG: toxin-antitoxin system YwqK family antitoxin, partial [Planctomycetota bacterium]